LDVYSCRIVRWAMEDHLRADLPLAAWKMAISARRPGVGPIHHSDRGVQYASADYRKVMQSVGFRASILQSNPSPLGHWPYQPNRDGTN